ncbi:MAG: T9SS type A sorting domain-containing protein [Bacteroidota bacterium]
MKKLFAVLLFAVNILFVFAQSWTDEVTSIQIGSNQKIASASDKFGIHILYYSGGTLKYGRINSAGSTLVSDITIATGIGNYAAITTHNDKIYAIYDKNTDIYIAKSTDGGSSWTTPLTQYSRTNSIGSLSATSDDKGVHVVWSEYAAGINEAYYALAPVGEPSPNWKYFKEVSDYSNHAGVNPSVAVSANEVHITYQGLYGTAKSRDFLINQSTPTWEDPVDLDYFPSGSVKNNKTVVRGNNVYVITLESYYIGDSYTFNVRQYIRAVNSSSFSTTTLADEYSSSSPNLHLLTTANGDLHLFYNKRYFETNPSTHVKFNGSSWSTVQNNLIRRDRNHISSVGNDLFLVQEDQVFSDKLSVRQYDAAPTTVQSPSIAVVNINGENYPRVSWILNPEPDVYANSSAYEIWRRDDNTGSGAWTAWSLKSSISGSISSYTDTQIFGAGFGPQRHEYKVRAKDVGNNTGNYSSVVTVRSGAGLEKRGGESGDIIPTQYSISQNYPNPFNPATTITFSLPEATHANVTVFDALGRVVSVLVDEQLSEGMYSFAFDASHLSSGMYFYSFHAGAFNETRTMLLIK